MGKSDKIKNIKENSNLDAKKAINDDSLEQVSGGVGSQPGSSHSPHPPTTRRRKFTPRPKPPVTDEDVDFMDRATGLSW